MIDARVVAMLEDPDIIKRKQAVKALAKTRDRAAIPYLDEVATFDEDDTVCDMAQKAISYIQKHTDNRTNADATAGMTFTPTQIRRKRNTAEFDGTLAHSFEGGAMFEKARRQDVVRHTPGQVTPVEMYAISAVMIAGVVLLFSFFALNWYEASNARSRPWLNYVGYEFPFERTGLQVLSDKIDGTFVMNLGYNNNSRLMEDFYYLTALALLVPIIQISLGMMMFSTGQPPESWMWSQMLTLSGMTVFLFAWMYFDLMPFDTRLDGFGSVPQPTDFLGIGYWVAFVTAIIMTLIGALGQFYLTADS